MGDGAGTSNSVIHDLARGELVRLWNAKRGGQNRETEALGFVDPAYALGLHGYTLRTADGLGMVWRDGVKSEVAGSINHARKEVLASSRCTVNELRFTLAHELAHIVMHPHLEGLHRERKIDGPTWRKEQTERDADEFAAELLMPRRLLQEQFARRFQAERFVLDDDTAWALSGCSLEKLLLQLRCPRDLARLLAEKEDFNGRGFGSLTWEFRVSPTAMAIQLGELGLIGKMPRRV